ncbi:MAG: GNAT family N-acetyltransferase [Bradyrhizobium sp.]|uniref:GNAT family N-acetyltransferase n=1 Tax=Bradyrhizobium sp. TaxID=376 RepID=UPI001D1F58FD|nr:GNAT family N-acetyltransferase [Bradyrhizobium sp.]MBV9559897.1 GNAT family N-acetyltransferase [Bradyrhizobium sp.]
MPADPIEIRLLTPDEAALYRDIRLDGLRETPDAFASTFAREDAMTLAWFAERIVRGNIFGAFSGDALVGVAGYWPQEGAKVSHKAGLWGMYVRPAARGSGIGGRLIEAVVGHATGRVELLQLGVASGNEAALRLYRKMGFSEYGREMKALKQDGRYIDEILMVRFLTPD